MGKIVKFCNSCDEGFAAKFAFCPNCGGALEAFEMNPVQTPAETAPVPQAPAYIEPVEEKIEAAAPVEEAPVEIADEPTIEAAPVEVAQPEIVDEPTIEASAAETEEFTEPEPVAYEPEPAAVFTSTPVFRQTTPVDVDAAPNSFEAEHEKAIAEGGFYVTVIEEKNVKQRNSLLLGTLGIMLLGCVFGLAYSIFSRDLEVGAINDDFFNAILVDDVPMTVEEQEKVKKDKDAGGGGGGGREEDQETTRGDLANQSKNPTHPPDAKAYQTDNPDFLKTPPPQTEGNQTYQKVYYKWGDPNGRFDSFSNGTGSGGGQGSGSGTGQGSGRGTGNGSGNGSGSGGGLGSGNGNGTGSGDPGDGPPPRVVVSTPFKIISKPRPGYTDSARQANIQGTVILRVTFMANGSIGSISAVKGLPNGLTEQAIAAARRIAFTPAQANGVPQSVTKQIEYSFSIY